jgi:hypothetical protein
LLRGLLPGEFLGAVEFVAGGDRSDVASLARTLVVRRRTPVAIVIDADALSPEGVRERQQSMEEVVRLVAGRVPVAVIVAAPELEEVFFEDPALLERVLAAPIDERDRIVSEFRPREVLERLLASSAKVHTLKDLLQSLGPQDLERLRQARPLRELSEFLRKVQAGGAKAAV